MGDILAWYNQPFWMMIGISFFFLAMQLVGGGETSKDIDTHMEVGTGDLELHTDLELDAELDMDIDGHMEIEISKDMEISKDVDSGHIPILGGILGFINVGRVPLSIILMCGFFSWGATGVLSNQALQSIFNQYQGFFFAIVFVVAFLVGMGLTRLLSRMFGSFFQEHTAATTSEDLIGCLGQVISGSVPTQEEGGLGRIRVYTEFGNQLTVYCVTDDGYSPPLKGEQVFITGYDQEKKLYTVLKHESEDFYAYLQGHHHQISRLGTKTVQSQQNYRQQSQ